MKDVAERPGRPGAVPEKTRRLLHVEDDELFSTLVRRWLARGGEASGTRWRVESAASLRTGLHALAGGGWDLVLLDLGLPDSTGPETFRRVASAALPAVPVLVFTGWEDERCAQEMLNSGAKNYLCKSQVDGSELYRLITDILENRPGPPFHLPP